MTPDAPVGPICSICELYEAIGSLMNLADYTTVRFCASCGPDYLGSIRDALLGADTTPDTEPDDDAPTTNEQIVQAVESLTDQQMADALDSAAEGAAAFPGTANVVRSTHGHRKGAGSESADA